MVEYYKRTIHYGPERSVMFLYDNSISALVDAVLGTFSKRLGNSGILQIFGRITIPKSEFIELKGVEGKVVEFLGEKK